MSSAQVGPLSSMAAAGRMRESASLSAHLMMLDHDQQTKNVLVRYRTKVPGFF